MKKTKKYQLMKRAVCMWCREQPALFGSTALYALLNAVIPYITLWFTAQILNELAGTRQRGLLIQKIVALLAAESVLLLLKAAALRWNHTLSDGFCMKLYEWKRHFDKLLSMDFCDMENPQTHELLNAVQQTSHWSSFGMRMVYYQFQNFLEAVFQLIGGIALSDVSEAGVSLDRCFGCRCGRRRAGL